MLIALLSVIIASLLVLRFLIRKNSFENRYESWIRRVETSEKYGKSENRKNRKGKGEFVTETQNFSAKSM
jgi:hypothetical protein